MGKGSPIYDHDHVADGSTIVRVASVRLSIRVCFMGVGGGRYPISTVTIERTMVHHMGMLNANTKGKG